ncbi:PREDICTED: histone-lysine N-methyltransferase setd3-like [Priapulus caudatus]|uniref:protein-histidine N-methyltransferase n=1 Tax=Priapulus caudatus TaxID=37621 RepID=A0ABM1FBU5_PRICU|nr:PREDICTED: histone-lysine N-methyltransferase setd3-like [Priapulus caudatus]
MGRKAVRSKIAPALRREVLQLAEQLLQKCTVPPNSVKEEWEQFVSIYELVQQIRLKEQAYGFVPPDRDARGFATFMKWAKSKGIKADKVDTAKFGIGGFGLRASAEIQEEELFLSVPKDAMMTIETANKSSLGWLIEIDPLLQNMPYVTLALHLLCEKFSSSSAWTSYINILPGTFTVPLYFTLEEFQMLKGDPAYDEALKQYRHIARQYAYFYKLFHTATDVKGILFLKENFSYDAYRWAVSVVMTRQNMIPSADTSGLIAALIPMWDMCNHINGKISTDFNPERNCSECYALQHFKKGEQVFIFYGARTNTLFLIHSGFVCKNNLYDTVPVKLGISKSDPLFYEKCILLTRLEISV